MPTRTDPGRCLSRSSIAVTGASAPRCCNGAGGSSGSNTKLLSLDATMIPVCLQVFDWAHYRQSKGAVKLHIALDRDGYLPQFCVISDGKTA